MPRFLYDKSNLLKNMFLYNILDKFKIIEDTFSSDFGINYDDIIDSKYNNNNKYQEITIYLSIYEQYVCNILWDIPINEIIYILKKIYSRKNIITNNLKINKIIKNEKIIDWIDPEKKSKLYDIQITFYNINKVYF